MAERPTALTYLGSYGDFGNERLEPDRFLYGIPARDLDAGDIAALSDDDLQQIADVQPPLYDVAAGGALPPAATAIAASGGGELEAMAMGELRQRAAERDIAGRGQMSKAELIHAIATWAPPEPVAGEPAQGDGA